MLRSQLFLLDIFPSKSCTDGDFDADSALDDLDKVEALIFGKQPLQQPAAEENKDDAAANSPATFVGAIMAAAEQKPADPEWVCNNPMFEDAGERHASIAHSFLARSLWIEQYAVSSPPS